MTTPHADDTDPTVLFELRSIPLAEPDVVEDAAPHTGSPGSEGGDRALVAGLRAGDEAAYETLVRRHGPRMLAVARSYLPVQEDAEDVLQSALLLVVRFIHGFEGASRLSTWLHRIVVNAALMRIRSRDRHPEARWDDSVGGDSDSRFAVHLAASGKDELSRRELHERLHSAIARLPPNVRAAVRLRDMDGLTLGETSVLLGQSRESIKTSLRRGRIALRRMLSGGNGSAS